MYKLIEQWHIVLNQKRGVYNGTSPSIYFGGCTRTAVSIFIAFLRSGLFYIPILILLRVWIRWLYIERLAKIYSAVAKKG